MKLSKLWAPSLVAILGLCGVNANAQDALDASRRSFMQAYNDQRYDQLCDLLHKDATFRGKLFPDRWTHTADRIITERWMSARTCTQIKETQGAARERRAVDIFTVGQSNITITPSRAPTLLDNNGYRVDTGQFEMSPKPGSSSKLEAGAYLMLWKYEDNAWKLIHIDMASGG